MEAELLKKPDCEENQQVEKRTRFGSTLTRLYLMGGRCRRGRIEQERGGYSAGTGCNRCMNMGKRGEQSEGTDANTGLTYSDGGMQLSFAL